MFNYTAIGSGYYHVLVDGVAVSKHTAEREAIENSNVSKLAKPASDVRVRHDYEVEVEFSEAPSFVDASVGQILNLKLVASDPSAVSISGLSVTPLKAADVELSVEVA
jgi:hypothetical protein